MSSFRPQTRSSGDYMAYQRQQRRAQAREELRFKRADWDEWEWQAAQQAEQQRRKANRVAKSLEDRMEETAVRKSPSDAELDRMQERFSKATQRHEEKQSFRGRRQQYYKGAQDLDPSGRLGRKVERLTTLTEDIRSSRLAQQRDDREQQVAYSRPKINEAREVTGVNEAADDRLAEGSGRWLGPQDVRWDAEAADTEQQKVRSVAGSWAPQSSPAASYDWTGAAVAAFPAAAGGKDGKLQAVSESSGADIRSDTKQSLDRQNREGGL